LEGRCKKRRSDFLALACGSFCLFSNLVWILDFGSWVSVSASDFVFWKGGSGWEMRLYLDDCNATMNTVFGFLFYLISILFWGNISCFCFSFLFYSFIPLGAKASLSGNPSFLHSLLLSPSICLCVYLCWAFFILFTNPPLPLLVLLSLVFSDVYPISLLVAVGWLDLYLYLGILLLVVL
jgi:hypothetical protein